MNCDCEILFRGKRVDNKNWVYGYYLKLKVHGKTSHIIVDENGEYHKINPKTRGRYIGLIDNNNKKIFEGDFLVYPQLFGKVVGYIYWWAASAQFQLRVLCDSFDNIDKGNIELYSDCINKGKIIGNIHDNSVWLDRTTPRKWNKLLKNCNYSVPQAK